MTNLTCPAFTKCGGCVLKGDINEQKNLKLSLTKENFKGIFNKEILFFPSPSLYFRSRAEFRIWHKNDEIFYAMHSQDNEVICIENCAIVNEKITNLMPILLQELNKNSKLKEKIFACEFVSSSDEICVILLYHKDIFSIENELKTLSNKLKVNLIARSRLKKLVFSNEILNDKIKVNNKILHYQISHDSFIQPNSFANENMLNFVFSTLEKMPKKDLCELYCGHGNFSIALSGLFNQILATEINKKAIFLANKNAILNNINNISFVRLSADELTMALNKQREFKRLANIDLKNFDFSHILVDPPRAGCDKNVLNLMKKFNYIIYISCNQTTLLRDLQILLKTHKITNLALFDQFVHTKHIETIALLTKA